MAAKKRKIGVAQARKARSAPRVPAMSRSPLPLFTYDPALEAERRAGRRGLADLLEDARLAGRYGKQDLRTALRTIRRGDTRARQDTRVDRRRALQDLERNAFDSKRSAERSLEDIASRREQLLGDANRARQDFATRLQDISRSFGQLRSTQNQAINATGVTGASSGAGAAAQTVRAENQRLAEQPIHTASARMEEDLATNLGLLGRDESRQHENLGTALGRLGTARGQMEFDAKRWGVRQGQDVARDRMLTKRDYGRNVTARGLRKQRGMREQKISDANLVTQQIWQARQNRPGAFRHLGKNRRVM